MIKTVMLLKRRPDLTMAEFIDRYENRHAKLAEQHLRHGAVRYVRRYLQPIANPMTGLAAEPEFDVISEIWYPDQETLDRVRTIAREPARMAALAEDEVNLFDRERNRFFLVEEYESDLTGDVIVEKARESAFKSGAASP